MLFITLGGHFGGPIVEDGCLRTGPLFSTFHYFGGSVWDRFTFLAFFITLEGQFGKPIAEDGCLRTGPLFGTFHHFGRSVLGASCRGWLLTNRSTFWHFSSLWGVTLGSQLESQLVNPLTGIEINQVPWLTG